MLVFLFEAELGFGFEATLQQGYICCDEVFAP